VPCVAQEVVDRARERGYLQTISGRRRLLPTINSPDWNAQGHAERVAVNGTCQGSAADLVKGAMVQLLSDLRAEGLSNHCRMMVQVGCWRRGLLRIRLSVAPVWCWCGGRGRREGEGLTARHGAACLQPHHTRTQVHDELVFEVSATHQARIEALVRRVMEGTAQVWGITLPMPVKISVGHSWGQLTQQQPGPPAAAQEERQAQPAKPEAE
jgi:hypothetical protein